MSCGPIRRLPPSAPPSLTRAEVGTPFFSVVIPTRNRPHYVGDAIASVLLQDDPDVECVVSDNFNDPSTRDVVDSFASDPRLRSYRTDHVLNMLDHWEFATRKASGEWVLLLSDRKLLRQGALRRLRGELQQRPDVSVFSVGVRVYDDRNQRMGWQPPRFQTRIYSPGELMANFLGEDLFGPRTLDFVFPKTLNGGYRRTFAEHVRSSERRYFNNPGVTTPDMSSFFVNCALGDRLLHVSDPLILTQGEHESNGRRFGAGDATAYLASLGLEDVYANVPLKFPFIYNLLTVDFLRIRSLFGGCLASFEPDWQNYFRTLHSEWGLKEQAGILSRDHLESLAASWEKACVNVLGQGAPERIRKESRVVPRSPLDPLAHVRDFVNHRFSHLRWVNRLMRHRFEQALDAAGFSKRAPIPSGAVPAVSPRDRPAARRA